MASNPFATARTGRIGLLGPALFMAALLIASGARAQGVPAPAAPQPYTPAELQTLVGPIALYVDDLIGIVLPASAYPLQVVQAARFLDARAQNPSLSPDAAWDDSVVALLNYPEVLRMMDQNLDWTSHLGEAFVYQQADLLDAIQQFRVLAQSAGNLPSNSYQTVAENNGTITVAPANPQVIYVPYYQPAQVITYYSTPVVRYYPYGYPVYDYPYPAGYSFSAGFFWGVTTAFVLNWHTHYVYVYPRYYAGHPYHGRAYHDHYYVRHYQPWRYDYPDRHDNVWRPDNRWGPQPHRHNDRRDRYTHADRQVSAPDRHHQYTNTDRQVSTPDRHGSSLTPAVAAAFSNSTRTQPNAAHGDDRRTPASGGGHRSDSRSDGYRAPATDTAKPAAATGTRSIQRTPLKPPQTARTTSPAGVAPAPSRPAAGNTATRIASTPDRPASRAVRTQPPRSVPTPPAAPRTNAAAVNRPPAQTPRVSAPPARTSTQAVASALFANQRTQVQPPRAIAPAAGNSARPPKASASPAPARQPQRQETARQGHGTKSEGRGKSQP